MTEPPARRRYFGVTPAPRALNQTKAERLAMDLAQSQKPEAGRTREQAAKHEAEQDLAQLRRQNKPMGTAISQALKSGTLTAKDIRRTLSESQKTPLQREFEHLTIADALKVWDAASPEERKSLRAPLIKKMGNTKELPPAQRTAILGRFRTAVAR